MSEICPRCGANAPRDRLVVCPLCLFDGDVLIGGAIALEEEIGRGAMGNVFRAHHLGLDRTVAVKFLPPELAAEPDFHARFAREARILAMLDHPNIVAVHDFGADEGQWYIVMEYVDGASLAAQIPLPAARAIDVARQICRALDHAHRKGVVHRDIKPENVFVTSDGRVKVGDFGIARLVLPSAQALITVPDRAAGTPYFLAPEALAGAPPDPRMDIYSLGVVLHCMVTGGLPAGEFGRLAPPALDRIVRKALAADPAARYGSAVELERDLAGLDLESPLRESSPSADEDRPWVYAVALLLTVATATALWALLMSTTLRVLEPDEVVPLTMVRPETLGDGRVLSRARFETWPILGSLLAFSVALTGFGLLRLYWVRHRILGQRPRARIREARWVMVTGMLACVVFALGRPLPQVGAVRFLPVLGGAIEVLALFFLWAGVLQAVRNGRRLRQEPGLWVGFALALVPPVTEFFHHLATRSP